MTIAEQRTHVPQLLEQVDDEFFTTVYTMLETYVRGRQQPDPIIGYETDGTPVTARTFLRQADEAMAAVDRGEYITLEDLEKESEAWLERTE
jgi:hypothetical protein